jgi:hypothetical protein
MKNKVLIRYFLWSLVFAIGLIACSNNKCYKIVSDSNQRILEGSLVVQDEGIIGTLVKVDHTADKMEVELCAPRDLLIPNDSKIFIGFMKTYASPGIFIVSGTSKVGFSSEEIIMATSMDSITTSLMPLDTALKTKATEILKTLNDRSREFKEKQ